MPEAISTVFTNRVLKSFDSRNQVLAQESLRPNYDIRASHPDFADLRLGERRTTELASVFLDLRQFTSRSFWDAPEEAAELANAVLSGFTYVVETFGGYVIGLRGDGLLATFGTGDNGEISTFAAAAACAVSLNAVQTQLNPELERRGIQTVQVRAGADYGPAVFMRTGTAQSNEVNVVGFPTNFAAKCEKKALSWEVVVGEGFANELKDKSSLSKHTSPPTSYTREGETQFYHAYDYAWRPLLKELDAGSADELRQLYPELTGGQR